MADFTPVQRAKNALDNRKLNLSCKCPADQSKWSSLIWGLYANNPRITVYTGDPSDQGESKGYGKITANLDLPTFYAFLQAMYEVIDSEGEFKTKLENKNFIFPQGKRSEKPVNVSDLWFGKDKDGIIWISVTARDRPKIKFTFGPTEFHNFVNGDGSQASPAKISKLYAKAYVKILENMMTNMAVDNYVEPPKRDQPAGGNRNYSAPKQNTAVDDDLPF